MSSAQEPARIRRILVAIDGSATSAAALQASAELAQRERAELVGLFVEDVNLVRFAGLPFAREVSVTLCERRRVDVRNMERAMRGQALRARVALERVVERLRVHGSFRVARGAVIDELLVAAREADLIVLGAGGMELALRQRVGETLRGVVARAEHPVLVMTPGAGLRPPVVVLYDGSAAGKRALEIGSRLAVELGEEMTVLVVEASDEGFRRRREEVRAALAATTIAVHYRMVLATHADALRVALRQAAPGALLLPASLAGAPKQLGLLLAAARGAAVWLVR